MAAATVLCCLKFYPETGMLLCCYAVVKGKNPGYALCCLQRDIGKPTVHHLAHADLTEANLTEVCLEGVALAKTNLTAANLTGADLIGANLSEVDFSNATLKELNINAANFSDAILNNTLTLSFPKIWNDDGSDITLNHFNNQSSLLTSINSIDNKYNELKIKLAC